MITFFVGLAAGCAFWNYLGDDIKSAYDAWRNG